ncbi:MAG: methylglyoxal synthase [Acidimicrobiia bacterium]
MTPELDVAPRAPRTIALVAHDHMKADMLAWARYNVGTLSRHRIIATGTTGALLERELGLEVTRLRSGPLGGDQQLGAKICEGDIDLLLFFWDPLEPQPHDPDVKALLRIAVVWNIPVACNRATADFVISSPLLEGSYERALPDHDTIVEERVETVLPRPRAGTAIAVDGSRE